MGRETTRAIINWARAEVHSPTGNYPVVSFIYNHGKAAAWREDKTVNKHFRVLFSADAVLVRPTTAREPVRIRTGDEEWIVKKLPGGYG